MGLTPVDRGVLETFIDKAINEAKMDTRTFADEKVRKAFHINNSEDFVFGMAYGQINASFSAYFTTSHRTLPSVEELVEITDIIFRRLPEIKKSISFEE